MDRKEAIRQFKEQKPLRGTYAVRCTATGAVWIGSSRNLGATRNGLWFGLRQKAHLNKVLQEEWNAHGEDAFQYEILESLNTDVLPMAVPDLLKDSFRQWM